MTAEQELERAVAQAIRDHGRDAPAVITAAIVSRRWIGGGWKLRSIAAAIVSLRPAARHQPLDGQLSLLEVGS